MNIQLLETGDHLQEHQKLVNSPQSQRVLKQIRYNAFDSLVLFVVNAHESGKGGMGTLLQLKNKILKLDGAKAENSNGIAHRYTCKYPNRKPEEIVKVAELRMSEIATEFRKINGYDEVKAIRNKRVAHFDKPEDWTIPLVLQQDKLIEVARCVVRRVEVLRRAWECRQSGIFSEKGAKSDAIFFWDNIALGLESRK